MAHPESFAVLSDEEREALRLLVETLGLARAAEVMLLNKSTLTRAIAGMPVTRGSAFLARAALGL